MHNMHHCFSNKELDSASWRLLWPNWSRNSYYSAVSKLGYMPGLFDVCSAQTLIVLYLCTAVRLHQCTNNSIHTTRIRLYWSHRRSCLSSVWEDDVEVYHSNYLPLEWTVPHHNENTCYAKLICVISQNVSHMYFVGNHTIHNSNNAYQWALMLYIECFARERAFC